MKRLFAIVICISTVFLFSSCNNNNTSDSQQKFPSEIVSEISENKIDADVSVPSDMSENNITDIIDINIETNEIVSPENMNIEQIVEFYKKSAELTHSKTKSQHTIELKNISVNNGQYEKVFNFITPIMAKLLANNSEDKDGITGGHKNLTVDDVASAKSYKSGNNTVIEMTMKEQISSGNEDALSGSVGHAITAVGDIGVVTKQLKDLGLPLEFSEKDTRIVYTDPTARVVINEKGFIINGTWKYTVSINLNNYKAFGKHVDTTSVVMDNILTVNGGFKG